MFYSLANIFAHCNPQDQECVIKGGNNFFFKFVSYIQQIPLTNKMLLKLVFKWIALTKKKSCNIQIEGQVCEMYGGLKIAFYTS